MVTEEHKTIGLDETDQRCVNCSPNGSTQNKEDVSLSLSSEDEMGQAISLNMNKKSSGVSYKGIFLQALFFVGYGAS